jgi:tRNA(fMet)-specific endonuclease VapC
VTGSQLYLLDTNITAYIINGRSSTARETFKATLQPSRVGVSAVTQAEILFGLELRPDATRLRASVVRLFDGIEVLPWDSAAAAAYSRLRASLQKSGHALSAMDLLIASHAIATGAILVSHDQAFHHVRPWLTVIDWAIDLK